LETPTRREKRDIKQVGKLDKVLLIRVTLPPFDIYILFQPAKQHFIFSIMLSQIELALNPLKGRPRYFIGK
jgi:hypothetical protein